MFGKKEREKVIPDSWGRSTCKKTQPLVNVLYILYIVPTISSLASLEGLEKPWSFRSIEYSISHPTVETNVTH